MNNKLKKTGSKLDKFKRLLLEQLWLILLLAPLVIIAILVGPNFESNKKQIISSSKSSALLAVSVEVSTAELVSILAKPLSELLVMDVYFDHQQNGGNRAQFSSVDFAEDFRNEAYNKSWPKSDARYLLVGETLYDKTNG